MSKEQNCKNVTENKRSEVTDFFQLLQNNGMFVDCVSPVKEAMEEIENQLK